MHHARRISIAVALLGTLTVGAATAAAGASTPRPSHGNVTGGSTTIKLSKASLKAMKKNGFTLSAISPATFNGKTLKSPIKGGNFQVPTAKITVAGGFKISHGGKSVSVTKLHSTSSVNGGSGTAIVTGQGRIPATVTSSGTPTLTPTMIKSTGFTVTLDKPLVKVLDSTFGTKLFKTHAQIGTGSATVRYHNN